MFKSSALNLPLGHTAFTFTERLVLRLTCTRSIDEYQIQWQIKGRGSPYFGWKKDEITEERKAGRASKTKPTPPPPPPPLLSLISESATETMTGLYTPRQNLPLPLFVVTFFPFL